jgi:photosystem II stability/assembly factor-like uncharacterized protein
MAISVLGASFTAHAQSERSCESVAQRGGWLEITLPIRVQTYSVDPVRPDRLLAASDNTVLETVNGGCTWREILVLPASPSPQSPYGGRAIKSVVLAEDQVILVALDGPFVLHSDDGGNTWSASEGLIPGGTPSVMRVAPSDPNRVYMVVSTHASDDAVSALAPTSGSSAHAVLLYATEDGGRTWEARGDPTVAAYGPRGSDVWAERGLGLIRDLAVDPRNSSQLWAATTAGLLQSKDGGGSWQAGIVESGSVFHSTSVTHQAGMPSSVIAVDPKTGVLYRSDDSGKKLWQRYEWPGFKTQYAVIYPDTTSAWTAHAGGNDDMFVAGPKGVFRYFPPGDAWIDITPDIQGSGPSAVRDLSYDPATESLFGLSYSGIVRYASGASGFNGSLGGLQLTLPSGSSDVTVDLSEVAPQVRLSSARLTPATSDIALGPGESETRTYMLALPPRPKPLDVYFLTDATGSMANTISALTRGLSRIVTQLREAGIDVQAGVGSFKTYPSESDAAYPYLENYAYRRHRDIGPIDRELAKVLLELEGNGGSGANLTALWQSASGDGQDVLPPGSSKGDTRAGQNAHFRERALKVIVHVGDLWFGTPDRGDPNGNYPPLTWPGPPFETAIDALNEAEIEHIGLAVQGSPALVPLDADVVTDMRTVSSGTETLAPATGVDCDANGVPDLEEGDPLVCSLSRGQQSESALASIVVALLKAVRDEGDVSLAELSDTGVVTAISPEAHGGVNLRDSNRLSFDVTFTCGLKQMGQIFPVRLGARVRGAIEASAIAQVSCGLPDTPRVTGPVVPPPIPPVPPLQQPPANAQNIPQSNPQTQGQQQAQQQSQAQANASVVAQRQQQPQTALVHAAQSVREQLAAQNSMVRVMHQRSDPVALARYGVAAGTATLLMAFAFVRGVTVRQVARVRSSKR